MAVDPKGIFKDNSKLILSIVGIVVLSIMMSATAASDGGFFGTFGGGTFNNLNGNSGPVGNSGGSLFDNLGGSNDQDGQNQQPTNKTAQPISNGNNEKYGAKPTMRLKEGVDYRALIETNLGSITVDLYEESAPENVNSFVFLATENFYDGSSFHRIINDYVIQGGDPLGTGFGGPGYVVEDEINSDITFRPFIVAMANSASNTNGSQFFIVSRGADLDQLSELNGSYTIIGEVVTGFNIVDAIEEVEVNDSYMPFEPVVIDNIEILER